MWSPPSPLPWPRCAHGCVKSRSNIFCCSGVSTPRTWPSPAQNSSWRRCSKSCRACVTLNRVSRRMSPTRSRCAGVRLSYVIHPLNQPASRHPQVTIPIRQRAQCETDQKARDPHQQADQEIRFSWQGRSRSSASRAPMDRLRFRNSYSPRALIAPRQLIHSGTRDERYAALVANTKIAAAADI